MVLVIVNSVCHRILRIALAVPVIVDYQISGKPHEPIRKVALFRVGLLKRLVDADKNVLGEVLGRIDARGKTVSEVEDSPGVGGNDVFPRRAVARSSTSDEFRTIYFGHSL